MSASRQGVKSMSRQSVKSEAASTPPARSRAPTADVTKRQSVSDTANKAEVSLGLVADTAVVPPPLKPQTYERNEGDKSIVLARMLPKLPNTKVDESHPLRLKAVEVGRMRQASTLEIWFDAGFMRSMGEHGELVTAEAMQPPDDYEMIEGGLLRSKRTDINIWPIKYELSEESPEKRRTTMFHYTHKQGFDNFVAVYGKLEHALANGSKPPTAAEMQKSMLDLLMEDCKERDTGNISSNPRGEPELTLLEPQRLESKQVIIQQLFGKKSLDEFSRNGNRWSGFADYCFAFSVPATVCVTVVGAEGPIQATLMRIDVSILGQINTKARARKETAQHKAQGETENVKAGAQWTKKIKGQGEETTESKSKGIMNLLSKLCGTSGKGSSEIPEYWDDGAGEEEDDYKNVKQSIFDKKKPREMDMHKKKVQQQWMREHAVQWSDRKGGDEGGGGADSASGPAKAANSQIKNRK